ncbi:MAG: uridine diphosphate-N-acetylglucosamine-binding protein YvcK [Thermoanaerobaculia bacterium]|nr:uridine diphosphate-N-acetylglucosamine-binding protein YvcK [Thermoanaerobaculia bacterium]
MPANLVAIGGGTGLAVLLRGLKRHVGDELADLAAVVTVSDDGGSSGRLRRELGVLPPGDIRSCIVALASDEDLLTRLFQYRFPNGGGLSGHSFGNLLLTALSGITGDFYQAILTAESILSVRGRILPATLTDVRLHGVGASGRRFEGESAVGLADEPLERVELEPGRVAAFPPAVEAIAEAHLVVLGPGSLYTSILPNLLIPEIREAIEASRARVVLPLNLMTQPGETAGMTASDHLRAIEQHAGEDLVDVVLINERAVPEGVLAHYRAVGATPIEIDEKALAGRGVEVRSADLLDEGELIRHHPGRLSAEIVALLADGGRGE